MKWLGIESQDHSSSTGEDRHKDSKPNWSLDETTWLKKSPTRLSIRNGT